VLLSPSQLMFFVKILCVVEWILAGMTNDLLVQLLCYGFVTQLAVSLF